MKIANIIGFAGSVILTLSITVWIAPFFSVIMPLPFLFYFSKLGVKEGLITGIITLLLVGLLGEVTGQPYLIFVCLEFGIVGLVLSELFKRQFSIGSMVFWGTATILFMGAVFLFLTGMSEGKGAIDMIMGDLQANLSKTVALSKQSGLSQEQIEQLKQAFDFLSKLIARIYPAIIIVGTGFIVWLNVVLSKPVFRRGRLSYPAFGDTDKWCAPEYMVWGIIGAGFALFLPATGIRFVAENLLIVLSVIYVFHGLSIIMFFFNKHGMPGWARVGIYVLIVLQAMFLVLLAFLGLFDQWADFRKIHIKIDPESI